MKITIKRGQSPNLFAAMPSVSNLRTAKAKRLLVIMFLAIPFCAFSQAGPLKLSLDEAVEYSVRYNKQLQVSQKDIDAYREKVREAISQGLPQVSADLSYSTNFGYEAKIFGESVKFKDQSDFRASLSQLIFNGQWIVGIQTARIGERLAMQRADISELDVTHNVMDTYFAILVIERTLDILRQNLANMEETLRHTQNMYAAGTVEITDVNQIRINVGQLKNSTLSTERALQVNYNLLKLQLGMRVEQPLELTDTFASFLNESEYMQLLAQDFVLNNNPEYRLQNTQIELQEKMVALQKWSFAPTVSGTYSYTEKIKKPTLDFTPKHAGTLALNLPIFTGFQRRSALAQQQITLSQTELNKSFLEDQLNISNEQYRFELENAMENYLLQKENIEVAGQVLANFRNKYEFGVISSLDLTNANNNYLQAESDFTQACLTLFQARTQLERLYNQLPISN